MWAVTGIGKEPPHSSQFDSCRAVSLRDLRFLSLSCDSRFSTLMATLLLTPSSEFADRLITGPGITASAWIRSMQCSLNFSHSSTKRLRVGVKQDLLSLKLAGGWTRPGAEGSILSAFQLSSRATGKTDEKETADTFVDKISTEWR